MYSSAYETVACVDYNTKPIIHEIERARIDGQLHPVTIGKDEVVPQTYAVGANSKDIPPFAHPLVIEGERGQDPTVVIDARGVTKLDSAGNMIVSSESEYRFLRMRAVLNRYWLVNEPRDFLTLGEFPMRVYIRWLTNAIGKRLMLEPNAQMRVSAILGYFYYSLFRESDEAPDERERTKIASMIGKATAITVENALDIIDDLPAINTVHQLTDVLETHGGSGRLEKFNTGLLVTLVGGSWFGFGAKEISAVAIEHPPTFLAMLYVSLEERGYRKTQFTKLVQELDKRDAGDKFTKMLLRMPLLD